MSVIATPRSIEQPSVLMMKPPTPQRLLPGGSPGGPEIVSPPGVLLPEKGACEAFPAVHPLPVPDAANAADTADQQEPSSDKGRSSPTLGDIFRHYGDAYLASHAVTDRQRKVIEAIRTCRTFQAGWHVDVCSTCGHAEARANSCGDRHCPLCQGKNRFEWVEARVHDLLPVPYYHAVFTLPDTIFPFCLYNQKVVYDLLFHSAAETLKAFGKDEQWFGADKMGFFGVLHTWGQPLNPHPHVHVVVPAGGLNRGGEWVWPRYSENNFLFPVSGLSKVFCGKFIAGLKQAYADGEVAFPGQLAELEEKEAFEAWLDALVSKQWVVYSKAPFSGPLQVLRYVSRYTHRVAISNSRILSMDDGVIRFRYKNYKKKKKKKKKKDACASDGELWEEMELPVETFMQRFLYHVLPRGYHRIRSYGFFNGSQKWMCQQALEELVFEEECGLPDVGEGAENTWAGMPCPACEEGVMVTVIVVNRQGRIIVGEPLVLAQLLGQLGLDLSDPAIPLDVYDTS
ncbi:MAG: IS91 family transposase [Candidatus Hodarchaeota archaeon]